MKSLQKLIAREIGPLLEREGFTRKPGDVMSFTKRIENERELHVDIHDLKYAAGFSVNMQDLSWDGKTARARSLERLVGLKQYSYMPGDEHSLEHAVRMARHHLEEVGLRWLSDSTFTTEVMSKTKASVQLRKYDDLIKKARAAFKNEQYEEALVLFSEAATIQELDAVSEKYRAIATSRVT